MQDVVMMMMMMMMPLQVNLNTRRLFIFFDWTAAVKVTTHFLPNAGWLLQLLMAAPTITPFIRTGLQTQTSIGYAEQMSNRFPQDPLSSFCLAA